MADHILVVMSEPTEGQVDTFNNWYDTVHLPEMLTVPGVVAARRYQAGPALGAEPPRRFLAIYEINGSVEDALAAIGAAAPGFNVSPAFDAAGALAYTFTPIGDEQVEKPK